MKRLVINSGSSSIKFQLLQMPAETVLCQGMADRIGGEGSQLSYKTSTVNSNQGIELNNHRQGLQKIVELLLDRDVGVIRDKSEIKAVGHRVGLSVWQRVVWHAQVATRNAMTPRTAAAARSNTALNFR